MKRFTKVVMSLALSVAMAGSILPIAPATTAKALADTPTLALAAASETQLSVTKGILDALNATGSEFSKAKETYKDIFTYEVTSESNVITLSVKALIDDYKDSAGDFYYAITEDSYVTFTGSDTSNNLTPMYAMQFIVPAIADYLKMDYDLISQYDAAAFTKMADDAVDTQYYKISKPDEHGLRTYKVYASTYADDVVNALLNTVYFDEKVASEIPALTEDTLNQFIENAGKYHVVISGNKYVASILFYEYGTALDENAITSIKNIVAALKPDGYEDFAQKYNGTNSDSSADAKWAVSVPSQQAIADAITDPTVDTSKYSFLSVIFTNPYINPGNMSSMKSGDWTYYNVEGGTAVSWKSSNTKVAKVNKEGLVDALKKGTATITATLDDGTVLTTKVTVTSNPTIKVGGKAYKKATTYKVKKGKTISVKITGKSDGVKNVYSSKNKKIAKVTSKNTATTVKIKGVKKGKTTVTIKVNGVSFAIKVQVK